MSHIQSIEIQGLSRRTAQLESYIKTVLEPLVFTSLMEVDKLSKNLQQANQYIKKLEQKIPKVEGAEGETPAESNTDSLAADMMQQPVQQNPMMNRNPMMNNRMQQANGVGVGGNQKPMPPSNNTSSMSGILNNPILQNAIANNPMLAQQFAQQTNRGGGSGSSDPMEVIRKMKQSAQQLPVAN